MLLKDCPRCDRLLEEASFGCLRVDACPGCGGVWLDEGELALLAQEGAQALRRLDERYREGSTLHRRSAPFCPNCGIPLAQFRYPQAPDVELDGCPRCKGIWVDEGELASLSACIERPRRAGA